MKRQQQSPRRNLLAGATPLSPEDAAVVDAIVADAHRQARARRAERLDRLEQDVARLRGRDAARRVDAARRAHIDARARQLAHGRQGKGSGR